MITERQRKRHRNHLGSSDLAAILGLNPWMSGADVQQIKLYGGSIPETEAMRIGSALERSVIDLAEPTIGKVTRKALERRVPDSPILVHLDAITVDGGEPVEAKVVGAHAASDWGDTGTDDVPHPVVVQAHGHMMGCGAQNCWVVALIGGTRLGIYRVPFDGELADIIRSRASAWWQLHIVNRAPVTDHTPSLDVVRRIERIAGKTIPLDDSAERLALEYEQLRNVRLASEKAEDARKAELLAMLGDAEVGTFPCGGRVEVSGYRKRTLDQKALQRDYPDAYAACMAETIVRTMRLKGMADGRVLERENDGTGGYETGVLPAAIDDGGKGDSAPDI